MPNNTLTYEQPLNELIRICLRLEHLFEIIHHHINHPASASSRAALTAILDVLAIIERPDLKTKLVKALSLHAERLTNLEKIPGVDQTKLAACLSELDTLIDILHTQPGRIGQTIKENDFLTLVKQRLSIPAGDCNFNLPCYQRWLASPAQQRIEHLHHWLSSYTHLETAFAFLLKLTRQTASPTTLHIHEGFHQQNLDASVNWQYSDSIYLATLRCIYILRSSVGPHRLSIRLHQMNVHDRATA